MKSLPAILVSTWAPAAGSLQPGSELAIWRAFNNCQCQSKHSDCVVCDPRKIEASPFGSQQTADCKRFLIFHAIKSGISSQTPHATSWHRTSQRCSVRSISSIRSLSSSVSWPRVRRLTKTNVSQRKLPATCLFSISACHVKWLKLNRQHNSAIN